MFKFLQEASNSYPVKVTLNTGQEVCVHKVIKPTDDNSGVIIQTCDGSEVAITRDEIQGIL